MKSLPLVALTVCLVLAQASALPPNFEQQLFVGGLKDPATMTFAPDGRLFVGERIAGKIRVITSGGQLLPTPFLTLDVPPERHRSAGIRGFAFDPNYPASPYLYVFYLKQFSDGKRHNRLSRFTVSPTDLNLASPGSEVVLLELPFNDSATGSSGSHNGGAVVFGGDGKLYVTTGDGWDNSNGYFGGDNVQSLTTYTGKVFRINRDGSIPTDNPFYTDTTGDYRAIYALGLRNPYAATVHPVSGKVYVFDVGTANGSNKDHIFQVDPADNYGHDGNSNIGNRTGTWAKAGVAIVSGGAWYYGNQFPASYQGHLFVTSWRRGLRTVASEADTTVADFGAGDVPNQGPLCPAVGPDGSLYYLDSTYETSNGTVNRIVYTAASTVASPTISPGGGSFVDSVTATLDTATPGAEIRYTTDGSIPDTSSPLYTAPLPITATTDLRARVFVSGSSPSPVVSAIFTILPSEPPAFTSAPATGAALSSTYLYTVEASGVPAPAFSLDVHPEGMGINPSTGEISWTPSSADPAPVTVRASNGVPPDATQSFTVTVTNFRPADTPDEASLTGGLRYAYFEGDDPAALASGTVSDPDLSPRFRDDDYGFRFSGYLEVPADGDYTFTIGADGPTGLAIGNALITGSAVGLQAGKHAITLNYRNAQPPGSLVLRWSGPGIVDQIVPTSAFSHHLTPYGILVRAPSRAFLNFPSDGSGTIPATLSATGAFQDLSTLDPSPGVIPYQMNAPFWSDGALKSRWISIPTGTSVGFDPTGDWVFPPGTVLIKHFDLGSENRRLETRFEIFQADGTPYLVTYRWRSDQTGADLVPAGGDQAVITFDGNMSQPWTFPSRADCTACHNASASYVLGPKTRQINGIFRYPGSGIEDNQLRTWSHLGLFANPPSEAEIAQLDRLAPVGDDSAHLTHRVRSYLDANCAYCHNPSGSPEGTGFVLDFNTRLEDSGVVEGSVANSLGLGSLARVIASQDPLHSVLLHRITTDAPDIRMPPVGREIVDNEGRDALLQWILSLPPANTAPDVEGALRQWTFDGVIDSGTWRAGTAPTFAPGQNGQALDFDGSSGAVDLGPLDVPGSALTISLWFRADTFNVHDARFLSKANGSSDQDHFWMLSTLNGSELRLRLRAGGNTTTLASPTGTLSTGIWTHIAAVYDGSTMRLYRDAAQVASTSKSGVLDTNGTIDVAIGNQPLTASGGSRPFDGLIDDLRIYDRALSPEEIAIVRDSGQQTNTPPTVHASLPPGIEGDVLTREQVASLTGSAVDAEDGDISASATWFSNWDGAFDPGLPGALRDGQHQIVYTGQDSLGSAVSSSFPLVVVPGFSGWLEDQGVSSSASPMDDLDGDSVTLLAEYAFSLSPWTPDEPDVTARITEISPGQDVLTVTFPTRDDAVNLSYQVQFSSDLGAWSDGAEFIPVGQSTVRDGVARGSIAVSLSDEGDTSLVTEGDMPPAASTSRFVRIQVRMAE